MSVIIETTLGDITVDLYLDQRPRTCLNFLKLCKVKYYNLSVFHKVKRNFIAQTGDPSQTGRGGESIYCRLFGEQAKYFDAELKPRLKPEKLGTICMVNNGNGMNGSQFFLTLAENFTSPDNEHTVFGEVAEGFETLLKLNEAICDPNDRPYQDIRITHTVVLHDPYEDPIDLDIPPSSPIPTKEQLQSNYIGADEEIDDTKGKNMEEIEEKIKDSEAKARATILEMVGDIPDADVKPPENVLFVCKLNPVTTSEDLEVIFSRFGPIVSCEVIKDRKTEESLQYAFIEFENEEDCENAYFKMDNVLIDDRRIHVDFSQSVSKMKMDDDNKFRNVVSQKRETLVLKEKVTSHSGYDMIFDMEENNTDIPSAKQKYAAQHMTERTKDHRRERFSNDGKTKRASQLRKSQSPNDKRNQFKKKIKRSPSYDDKIRGSREKIRKRSPSYDDKMRGSRERNRKRSPSYDDKMRRSREKISKRSPSFEDKLKRSKEKIRKRSSSHDRYSTKKNYEFKSTEKNSHSNRANEKTFYPEMDHKSYSPNKIKLSNISKDKRSNKRSRSPGEKSRKFSHDFLKQEKLRKAQQCGKQKSNHSSSEGKHSRKRQSSTSSESSSSSSSSSDSSSQSDENTREKHRNLSRSDYAKQKYEKSYSSINKFGNLHSHSKKSESDSFSSKKKYEQNYSSRYKHSHK